MTELRRAVPEANPLNSHGRQVARKQAEAIGLALAMANRMTHEELLAGYAESVARIEAATEVSRWERKAAARWEKLLFPRRVEERCWASFRSALDLDRGDFPAAVLSSTYAVISPLGR